LSEKLSFRILTLKVTVSGFVPVSGDIFLPSLMRGGQTLEDMEVIVESLSCVAIALLNPGSAYALFGYGVSDREIVPIPFPSSLASVPNY
jgi:hypothetical protein